MTDVTESDVQVCKETDGYVSNAHSSATPLRVPSLPIANNALLGVGREARGLGDLAVGLAAWLAEVGCGAAKPKLGAAYIERAYCTGGSSKLTALGRGVAIRLTAVAAIERSVATPSFTATASAIRAWLGCIAGGVAFN